MPATVITTPNALLSVTPLPLTAHPILTIEIVLRCPTTVLVTGPELLTIKNCEILIKAAKPPLIKIIIHLEVGTFSKTGMRSTNGTANKSKTLEIGAWLSSSCEDDIDSFL